MALKDVFLKAADTAFTVFESITHEADYVQITQSSWSDEPAKETLFPVDLILESLAQRDVQFLSFSNLLQPTDLKGLIKGIQLPRPLTTQDLVRVKADIQFPQDREFHVIAWNVDPADAVYTLLLREV